MPHSSPARPRSTGSPIGEFYASPRHSLLVDSQLTSAGLVAPWLTNEDESHQELEEVRCRAAQMEKTMQWWSDCTANWRDKWSKVRTERNRARDELRTVRLRLDTVLEQSDADRRSRQQLELQLERLTARLMRLSGRFRRHSSGCRQLAAAGGPEDGGGDCCCSPPLDAAVEPPAAATWTCQHADEKGVCEVDCQTSSAPLCLWTDSRGPSPVPAVLVDDAGRSVQLCVRRTTATPTSSGPPSPRPQSTGTQGKPSRRPQSTGAGGPPSTSTVVADVHPEALSPNPTDSATSEESDGDEESVDGLRRRLAVLRMRTADERQRRRHALRQLTELRAHRGSRLTGSRIDLGDLTAAGPQDRDGQIIEVRPEEHQLLEERQLRQKAESDKLSAEQECARLREALAAASIAAVADAAEVHQPSAAAAALQTELVARTRELRDLNHAHGQLKLALQQKSTQLGQTMRRADQLESEMRRLRMRNEELRRDLQASADCGDASATAAQQRRLSELTSQQRADAHSAQIQWLKNNCHRNQCTGSGSSAAAAASSELVRRRSEDDCDVQFQELGLL